MTTEARRKQLLNASNLYWARHPEKRMDWARANPERVRAAQRRFHGQPEPSWRCPERCELCGGLPTTGRWKKLHEDHDHETGEFRGWICHSCNIGLGHFKDKAINLRLAIAYLERTMLTVDKTLWYLAGPMSWVPQFNIPLFDTTSAKLRAEGFSILSPAELDSPLMRARALASPDGDLTKLEKDTNETWGHVLGRDVERVADEVGGIMFLPNWQKSRGAKLEAFTGLLTGKRFAVYDPHTGGAFEIGRVYVQQELVEHMP